MTGVVGGAFVGGPAVTLGARVEWPGMPVAPERAVIRMGGVELTPVPGRGTEALLERMGARESAREGKSVRYAVGDAFVDVVTDPDLPPMRQSAGSVHHVAFRVRDDATQSVASESLTEFGARVTPVQDRDYFHSIYFREPGGVLFEIATENPGFDIDEPFERLGSELRLPAQHEGKRARIEADLTPLRRPSY